MWVDIFGGRNGVNHMIRTTKLGKKEKSEQVPADVGQL